MAEELKVFTMRWIERSRIHWDVADTARFKEGRTSSDPVIEDTFPPGCEIVSVVYPLDIGFETTNFRCHNVEVRRTVACLLARCVGIAKY
jgi:hypothetical protein